MSAPTRVRFAPSPTGSLHVGGARTAIFSWLFARHTGGSFLLRLEDTDRSRFQHDSLQEIFASLRWLGLDWDEGPEVGGEFGPYVQSERLSIYDEHVERLIVTGAAYPCFCSAERLAKVREAQKAAKQNFGYDRHCRDLPQEEVWARRDAGEAHVVRLAVPRETRPVRFTDRIRGPIEYSTEVLDDLVLRKTDGFPTYHLANVVDDHLMGITHVMRGDEWIASTPKHVLLYEAFGWEAPEFAHLPVILSPDGGKLSKRKGAASVMDFKRSGHLPEALVNFLALLGWSPGDDREIMEREEMIAAFTLDRVGAKAAVFDTEKLEWMNAQYLMALTDEELLDRVRPVWTERGWLSEEAPGDPARLAKIIELMKVRAKMLTDLADNLAYFFIDPETYEAKGVKKHFKPEAPERLTLLRDGLVAAPTFDAERLEALYRGKAEELEVGLGKLVHPTRLAVSGVTFGPGLFEMLEVLGRETVLRRIDAALEWLAARDAETTT